MKATLKQAGKLIELADQKDMSDEHLQGAIGSGMVSDIFEASQAGTLDVSRRDDIREILGLPRLMPKPVITTYTVDINFSTLEEGIAAGKYDWANENIWTNENITAERFPITGNQGKKEVVTVHFGRLMNSSEEVIAELNKLGYKPAETADLLALGKDQPELQRQFPIIALGSSAAVGGFRYVPCLFEYDSRRGFSLDYFGSGWFGSCRFLAVRN